MKLIQALLCILLLAGIALLGAGTFVAIRLGALLGEAQKTNADLQLAIHEAQATLVVAQEQAKEAGRTVANFATVGNQQLTGIRADVQKLGGKLDAPLGKLGDAIEHVSGIRGDLKPSLDNLAGITESALSVTRQIASASPMFLDCDHNADCAFSRFQGTTKAVEKAAQNFGAMSTEVRGALPAALAGMDRIVANSDRTSAASAKLMSNLAEASKPLPRWLRWPLAITGAVAPSIGGVLAGAAATGAFR